MSIGHEKLDVYGNGAAELDPDPDSDIDLDEQKPQHSAGGAGKSAP